MSRRLLWLFGRACGLTALAFSTALSQTGKADAVCRACQQFCYTDPSTGWTCSGSKCADSDVGNASCTDLNPGCALSGLCKS
jgi:hypothetical protein